MGGWRKQRFTWLLNVSTGLTFFEMVRQWFYLYVDYQRHFQCLLGLLIWSWTQANIQVSRTSSTITGQLLDTRISVEAVRRNCNELVAQFLMHGCATG